MPEIRNSHTNNHRKEITNMKILKSFNVSKLDVINSTSSKSFKAVMPTDKLIVTGCAHVLDESEKGGEFAYLYTRDGEVYGGNAANAIKLVGDLCSLFEDEDGADAYAVEVRPGTSNSGKTFLTFHVSNV